jgi:hypothetical protein
LQAPNRKQSASGRPKEDKRRRQAAGSTGDRATTTRSTEDKATVVPEDPLRAASRRRTGRNKIIATVAVGILAPALGTGGVFAILIERHNPSDKPSIAIPNNNQIIISAPLTTTATPSIQISNASPAEPSGPSDPGVPSDPPNTTHLPSTTPPPGGRPTVKVSTVTISDPPQWSRVPFPVCLRGTVSTLQSGQAVISVTWVEGDRLYYSADRSKRPIPVDEHGAWHVPIKLGRTVNSDGITPDTRDDNHAYPVYVLVLDPATASTYLKQLAQGMESAKTSLLSGLSAARRQSPESDPLHPRDGITAVTMVEVVRDSTQPTIGC